MNSRIRDAVAGLTVVAVVAVLDGAPAGAAAAATPTRNALFVLNNDPAGNTVAVYHRFTGGTLVPVATYFTFGFGATALDSPGDPLASQGGLTYDHRHGLLF